MTSAQAAPDVDPTPVIGDQAIEDLKTEFRDAFGQLYRRLRAEHASDQISESQRSVLKILVLDGPHSLRELSDRERITPPSMNQTVNALVEAGYVTRSPDPSDGRKVILSATDAGVALIEENRRRGHAWLSDQIRQLSDAERRSLLSATAVMAKLAAS